ARKRQIHDFPRVQCWCLRRLGAASLSVQSTSRNFTEPVLMKRAAIALLAILVQNAPRDAEWAMHGGVGNIRYSPLTHINRRNGSRLHVAWTYDSHDAFKGSEMQSNPIVAGGVLYATTPTLRVIALDAATGKELWTFDPSGGMPSGARFRHRGVTVHDDRVFVTYRNWLYALDRKTGRPIESFGVSGRVDLRGGLGMAPERASVRASAAGALFGELVIRG